MTTTTPKTAFDSTDERRGRYLHVLQRRTLDDDLTDLQPWLSETCYQCGKPASTLPHIRLGEFVAIGCGGYLQINPNVLGIPIPDWDD